MKKYSNLVKVNDVYFISEQIKLIDNNYELYYDYKTRKYIVLDKYLNEIVLSSEEYPSYQTIKRLHITKRENFLKLLNEIEENNLKIEESNNKRLFDKANEQITELVNYTNQKGYIDLTNTEVREIIKE